MANSIRKSATVEEIKLTGNFERLREKLLLDKYAERRELPLAYWALPSETGDPVLGM